MKQKYFFILFWSGLMICSDKKFIVVDRDFFDKHEAESSMAQPNPYIFQEIKSNIYFNFIFVAHKDQIKNYIMIIGNDVTTAKNYKYNKQQIDALVSNLIYLKPDSMTIFIKKNPLLYQFNMVKGCLSYAFDKKKSPIIDKNIVKILTHNFFVKNLTQKFTKNVTTQTVYIILPDNQNEKIFLLENFFNINTIVKTINDLISLPENSNDKFSLPENFFDINTIVRNTNDINRLVEICNQKYNELKDLIEKPMLNKEIEKNADLLNAIVILGSNQTGHPVNIVGSLAFANIVKRISHEKTRYTIWKVKPYIPSIINYGWKGYQFFTIYSTLRNAHQTVGSLHKHIQTKTLPKIPQTNFGKAKALFNAYTIYSTFYDLYGYTKATFSWVKRKLKRNTGKPNVEE